MLKMMPYFVISHSFYEIIHELYIVPIHIFIPCNLTYSSFAFANVRIWLCLYANTALTMTLALKVLCYLESPSFNNCRSF